jgi:hypothetical protein
MMILKPAVYVRYLADQVQGRQHRILSLGRPGSEQNIVTQLRPVFDFEFDHTLIRSVCWGNQCMFALNAALAVTDCMSQLGPTPNSGACMFAPVQRQTSY